MNSSVTDRIEQSIEVKAPRSRVWRALVDSREFTAWFGIEVDGPFAPGARLRGTLVGTTVDAEVARAQRTHEGVTFDLVVAQVEPERRLSFRWHPGAVDPAIDYASEPMTLVEFVLEEIPQGTRVTVIESGFDAIPLTRRAQVFDGNKDGWAIMIGVLAKHLDHAS
jgi:uncharacterized protein YndB with AHSA1/START domain